jgi:acyl-CoA dehydrogenase
VYDASKIKQNLPAARSVIDLHIEKLLDKHSHLNNAEIIQVQLEAFEKWFDLAQLHHLPSMTIIHGVGKGKLKAEIHDLLKVKKGVKQFINQYSDFYGYGATEVFFDGMKVPAADLIGEEGKGFKYILDGMNAERILVSSESIGDARWFVKTAVNYAKERVVFDRPIGQNQAIAFPIARAHINVEAASLMRYEGTRLFDAGQPCGAQANMAKLLAADASWEAANACLQFHGGYGFACEYDVERKFRETRLYQVAPISTNLILSYVAEHVLGLPRSF